MWRVSVFLCHFILNLNNHVTAFVCSISFVRFRSFDFVRSISFVRFRPSDFVCSISFVRFRSFDFVRSISFVLFNLVRYARAAMCYLPHFSHRVLYRWLHSVYKSVMQLTTIRSFSLTVNAIL